MKIPLILGKRDIDQRKAVAPNKGAAAFSCSTRTKSLSRKALFSTVSQHFGVSRGGLYNLLPETHYFRRPLAKHPLAIVIRTEGMKSPLAECREVAP